MPGDDRILTGDRGLRRCRAIVAGFSTASPFWSGSGPRLPVEQPTPGDYAVRWTPIRPAYNTPDRWELEELQGLSVAADSFEAGTARWVLQGAELSAEQRRRETSLWRAAGGTAQAVTKGAPETVLATCELSEPERADWLACVEAYAVRRPLQPWILLEN